MKNSVFLLNGVISGLQGYFKVESYQRFFVWERQQVENFYNDILNISNNKHIYDYYLQTITYYVEDNLKGIIQLVDGQQRMTNLFLILLSYHNIIETYNIDNDTLLNENKDVIKHYYLKNIRRENKLYLQSKDNFYLKLIYNNSHNELIKYKKKSLLINAYLFYYQSLLKLFNSDIKQFMDFYKNGLLKLSVIIEECNDVEEAAQCFINKNAKGKVMEGSNVIISNLYFLLYQKIGVYCDEEINDLVEKIETIRLQDELDSFLQRFLYYKNAHIKSLKNISHSFDEYIDYCVQYNIELNNIINDMYNYFMFENDIINDNNLKDINFKLYNGLLSVASDVIFKIKNKNVISKLYDILNLCESFYIRRTLKNTTSNKLQVLFGMIENVYNENEDIIDSIKKFLNNKNNNKEANFIYASDEELKNYFVNHNMYKNREFTKHILCRINNYNSLGEKQFLYEETIEHILPKSLVNDNIVNTIGNLTILNRSMNSKLSTKEFKLKKELYSESIFKINRYFDDVYEWGYDDIKKRSEYLSEIAIKIWKM